MITVKIDVTKIDKSRLFQGKKGKYLNCVMIETPKSEYGDYMILQEQTQEERNRKDKGTIIGNAKIIESKGNRGNGKPAAQSTGGTEDDW